MKLRAEVYDREQLEEVLSDSRIEVVYAPMELLDSLCCENKQKEKLIIVPPAYLADCERQVYERLLTLVGQGFTSALAHTVGHIGLLRRAGLQIHGGVRLNVTNGETLRFLAENGLRDAIVSAELDAGRIERLKKPFDIGFIAYGHLPLMITRRCPVSDGKPCGGKRCGKKLTDRTGRKNEILCRENYVEILNSEPLDLGDRLERFRNADFAVLKFTVEKSVDHVVTAYCEGRRTGASPFTRGLYFRGTKEIK